jgi:cytochrome c biogenesis protein
MSGGTPPATVPPAQRDPSVRPAAGGDWRRRLATMPGVGPVRAFWRWLTSMRTALVLLLVLAVAAVPGSVFPQRNVSVESVATYYRDHPSAAPILDKLYAFDVYASPWFSAVYLLLFVSLVGCLVPRLRQHLANLVRKPPPAPARFDRLPHASQHSTVDDPGTAARTVRAALKSRRWRTVVREEPDGAITIAAEKGYLKETGNLVFHFALLALLLGVAGGSWYGWHANRLVVVGDEFCNTLQQYDEAGLGARTEATDLPPFCVTLKDFRAEYHDNGAPADYTAHVSYVESPDAPVKDWTLKVNNPLRVDGANVYLLGHGYAPVLRYTDRYGQTFTTTAPFLPLDGMLTSEGVAKFAYANVPPDGSAAEPAQLGLAGIYQPTVNPDFSQAKSLFPLERDPVLVLTAYQGDLGLGSGAPQSVYELDERQLHLGRLALVGGSLEAATHTLRPGESWTLPDGSTVEFLGTKQWITISVRHDPGEATMLGGAIALLAGLMTSLSGRRRRVWARITPDQGTGSVVMIGGLARTEYPGFADEFAQLAELAQRFGGETAQPAAENKPVGATERGQ